MCIVKLEDIDAFRRNCCKALINLLKVKSEDALQIEEVLVKSEPMDTEEESHFFDNDDFDDDDKEPDDEESEFKCPECPKKLNSQENLACHVTRTHGGMFCPYCNCIFKKIGLHEFDIHVQNHMRTDQ